MSYEDLSPDDLVEHVLEALDDDGRIRTDMLVIEYINDKLVVSGRVSSDDEIDLIDELLSEDLEIQDFINKVWVDDTLVFEGSSGESSDDIRFDMDDDDDLDAEENFESDDDGEI